MPVQQTASRLVRVVRPALLVGALMLAPVTGEAQSRSPNPAEAVSASKWVLGGAGLGVTQGGNGYAATLAFLPTAGFGFRFDDIHGVEVAASFVRSVFGNRDENLVETAPPPPSIDGITASLLTIRGSSLVPFNNVLGVGVGAYREDGVDRTNFGLQGYLETLARTGARGTAGFQLRGILLPNASAGSTFTLAVGLVLRSKPLGF
jgi:hypothetical protein